MNIRIMRQTRRGLGGSTRYGLPLRFLGLSSALFLAACGGGSSTDSVPNTHNALASLSLESASNGSAADKDASGGASPDTVPNQVDVNSAPLTPDPPSTTKPMGEWSPVYEWPQVAVHLHLLPNGKVLSWAYRGDYHTDTGEKQAFIVDVPNDGPPREITSVSNINPNTNLACSGHAFLPDGRLLVSGGESGSLGSAETHIFDYRTLSWKKTESMNGVRWYPTSITLASGEVLTLGGINFLGDGDNRVPQIWTKDEHWKDLSTAVLSVGEYPRIHLAPNGKVFKSGQDQISRYLDTSGTGAWSDITTFNYPSKRDYGTSVMYDNGKVIIIGGGDPPTNTAETINLYDAAPEWQWTAPMSVARRHLNATIIADGNILVTGGTSSPGFNDATVPALAAEMWNPRTGKWTTMASMKAARVYHSTALLLPDGRVMAAGGGDPTPVNGVDNRNVEIFSPPYLFAGPRPVIATAPAAIHYGETFEVETPDSKDIVKATWIRLSSVTHAFNMNQRINHLAVKSVEGGIEIVAPQDPNLTPPGHYMLFLINDKGVPSLAKIIQIE